MKLPFSTVKAIVSEAAAGFSEDKILTLGAALAYYTIFSIAPLLLISLAVAGWAFGAEASRVAMYAQLSDLVGSEGAKSIQGLVESASKEESKGGASVISFVIVFLGASGVFGQLQDALNLIWRVQPVPGRSIATILHQRLLSLSIVVVVAFMLLVSLIASAFLTALGTYFGGILPSGALPLHILNILASFIVITFMFAAIYKILPDVHLDWGDVWRGSIVTSLLFTLGKMLIGMYLGRAGVTSSFGAAGSLIGVVVWVYYSSSIILFGAEITRAFVRHSGHQVTLKPHTEFRPELEAAKEVKAPIHEAAKQG
jgi:membrane protein